MPPANFDGLRVLSLESRRARESEKLIRTYKGEPLAVPAMQELPLESNTACVEFGRRLLAGEFDLVLFLTGVGVSRMMDVLSLSFDREDILASLRTREIVARSIKPLSVLRELQIPVVATAAEPNTWRELLSLLDRTYGERLGALSIAVQEYGESNPELLAELIQRCLSVTKIPVYQWSLPTDLEPLRHAIREIIAGRVDVLLLMTSAQATHLFQVAEQMQLAERLRQALGHVAVLSIGPSTSEELHRLGVPPDFEPSHPKMGFLMNEGSQRAGAILAAKRAASTEAAAPSTGSRAISSVGADDNLAPFDVLQEISSRLASSDPLHVVLSRIVAFVSAVIPCDSCFLYTLEGDKLILRASRNPHAEEVDTLGLAVGEGVTGWVAEHRKPVAISEKASEDPRFSLFANLPEDRFEAMLCVPIICANRVVGVLNLQHREAYVHSELEQRVLATIGILVGAEIDRARLETENSELTMRLETRKVVDRAKGILQRDLKLSEDEAYRMMQRESRTRRKSMREIAEAVLLAESLRRADPAQTSA